MDAGELYAAGRQRVCELVGGLSQDEAVTPVPACPAWTVRDVLAHLAGVSADIVTGNLEGLTTEPWTQAQIEARRDASVADLVAEWSEYGPRVEALAGRFPPLVATQWLMDGTTHEQDIRGALGRPGARDTEAVRTVVPFLAREMFGASLAARGLPPVEVRAGDTTWTAGGEGPVGAVLQAAPFELLRAFTGRRSAAQIAALGWSTDPAPYVAAFTFGPFRPAQEDIHE